MTTGSGIAPARRRPATARPGGTLAASQRSQAVRMNLFVLVRILFQYLERVDKTILDLAKEVLKDCERKHNTKDSKYDTLADAINERVRDAVGETHWTQARKIQKQLAVNQQKKKLKSMALQRQRIQGKATASAAQTQRPTVSQDATPLGSTGSSGVAAGDAALEAAKAMSALSQSSAAPTPTNSATPNLFARSASSMDQEMGEAGTSNGNGASVPGLSTRIEEDPGGVSKSGPLKKRMMFKG